MISASCASKRFPNEMSSERITRPRTIAIRSNETIVTRVSARFKPKTTVRAITPSRNKPVRYYVTEYIALHILSGVYGARVTAVRTAFKERLRTHVHSQIRFKRYSRDPDNQIVVSGLQKNRFIKQIFYIIYYYT